MSLWLVSAVATCHFKLWVIRVLLLVLRSALACTASKLLFFSGYCFNHFPMFQCSKLWLLRHFLASLISVVSFPLCVSELTKNNFHMWYYILVKFVNIFIEWKSRMTHADPNCPCRTLKLKGLIIILLLAGVVAFVSHGMLEVVKLLLTGSFVPLVKQITVKSSV